MELALRAVDAFRHAVSACDPGPLIARDLSRLRRAVWVVAIGKAALRMASSVPRIAGGIVVVPSGTTQPMALSRRLDLVFASHPLPDASSLRAGDAVLRSIERADAPVLLLLSGGASSLVCVPNSGLALGTLRSVYERMWRAALKISDINTVRKHLEVEFKGGGLARRAPIWRQRVVSDVVGDDVSVIASGPAYPDSSTQEQAARILRQLGLAGHERFLRETCKRRELRTWPPVRILANHERLAQAAAARLRLDAQTSMVGPVEALARRIVRDLRSGRSFVGAGEATVSVRGSERGGRAQHLALWVARGIAGLSGRAFLAAGSDGYDGSTQAAGALVDGETWRRAERLGLAPARALARFASHEVLRSTGSLLYTGPTGTNVNDLFVGLTSNLTE